MLVISDTMVLRGRCGATQKGPSGESRRRPVPMPGRRQIAEPARSRGVRPRSKPTARRPYRRRWGPTAIADLLAAQRELVGEGRLGAEVVEAWLRGHPIR